MVDNKSFKNRVDVDWGEVKNKQGLPQIESVAYFVLEKMNKTSSHLSVILVSDDEMKKYNNLYRGIDSTTDVLSFAFNETDFISAGEQNENELGEIYISLSEVIDNAKRYNVSLIDEFARVIIHGVLHLLGYNHKTNDIKNEEMLVLQEKILKELKK